MNKSLLIATLVAAAALAACGKKEEAAPAPAPVVEAPSAPVAEAAARTDEYTATFATPWQAAARGYIDDVIDPRDTRPRLIDALQTLATKRDRNPQKKHGCIPL